MKINTIKQSCQILLFSSLALSGCNGGTNSTSLANTATQLKGATLAVPAQSAALFSNNNCLKGTIVADGSGWYINATLAIKNTCSEDNYLANTTIAFTSEDDSGGFASWSDANVSINNADYHIAFNQGIGNTSVGKIDASKAWSGDNDNGVIKAGQTITFRGGINTSNGGSFKTDDANNSISFNGEAPIGQYGALTVNVDTSKAKCSGKVCNNITVNLLNQAESSVMLIKVPANKGIIYSQTIESLAVGNYHLVASAVDNTINQILPSPQVAIQKDQTESVTVSYTAAPKVGKALITLASASSKYTGSLQVQIVNAKEANALVNVFSAKQGETIVTGDLLVSDASHQYKVLVQGIADPESASYFVESGQPVLKIVNKQTTPLEIKFKTAKVAQKAVTFDVSGLINNDKANLGFQDSTGKYAYVNYSGLTNGKAKYSFENGILLGYTIAADSGTYKKDSFTGVLTIDKAQVLPIKFESETVIPSGATVAGWPEYLAMGAVTDANTTNNGGLNNRPVDSIFKYSGDGGNGDPGRIVFPIYTMNTLAVAASLSTQFGHHVMPTMVVYTAEMSGGTAYKDLGYEQEVSGGPLIYKGATLPAMHFVNLMLDTKTLQDAKSANNPYPGSIVLNPDLLGMVQQQKLYDDNGTLTNLKVPVNQSLAQAVCFMTRSFPATSFTLNNGDVINVKGGTPLEIATQLKNSGKVYSYWDIKTIWENKAVDDWYPDCAANPTVSGVTTPVFEDSFKGWIQASNWVIKHFGPNVSFGWQENLWAVDSSNWLHQLNSENEIEAQISKPIIDLWNRLGVYNGTYKPDFVVFDRYEMDDSAAAGTGYWYNARDWDNYLIFVKQVSNGLGNQPAMLWQIPGGHIQTQKEVVANPSYQRASTAPAYFFGQEELELDLSNMANYLKAMSLGSSSYNCGSNCKLTDYMLMNNYNWTKTNNKLAQAANSNVFSILWGGGQTQSVGTFPIDDKAWLANKLQEYYKHPTKLK